MIREAEQPSYSIYKLKWRQPAGRKENRCTEQKRCQNLAAPERERWSVQP